MVRVRFLKFLAATAKKVLRSNAILNDIFFFMISFFIVFYFCCKGKSNYPIIQIFFNFFANFFSIPYIYINFSLLFCNFCRFPLYDGFLIPAIGFDIVAVVCCAYLCKR